MFKRGHWGSKEASTLILQQADAAAVSRQVHLALFYDAQLDIKAMGHSQ